MKHIISILLISFSLVATGCKKDMPEPEVEFRVLPMSIVNSAHDLPVTMGQSKVSFMVQHHIKGGNVFVECVIPNVSFRDNSKNQGKIILYIDGKKKQEINSAAFIIKGLERGTHTIKLEVVKPNNEPYNLQKEFTLSMP